MKRWKLVVLLALVLVIGPCGILLALPPWQNRAASVAQLNLYLITGIELHSYRGDYDGVLKMWDRWGRLRNEYGYKNGERHGKWIDYDGTGAVLNVCEYRNGKPWDGICHFWEGKAWIAEYKDGKPWNGALPAWDKAERKSVMKYYDDGAAVSEEDYKKRKGLPPGASVYGLHVWKPADPGAERPSDD